jgi:hypothetical protein
LCLVAFCLLCLVTVVCFVFAIACLHGSSLDCARRFNRGQQTHTHTHTHHCNRKKRSPTHQHTNTSMHQHTQQIINNTSTQ